MVLGFCTGQSLFIYTPVQDNSIYKDPNERIRVTEQFPSDWSSKLTPHFPP